MIAAALFFTLMNLCIKAAHQKFDMGSGELVFWRMLFAAVVLGGLAKLQGKTFSTPNLPRHLNRSVVGTVAMMCNFYAVMHLSLATGVTLSYTSSIFLAVLSFIVLRERISLYMQGVLCWALPAWSCCCTRRWAADKFSPHPSACSAACCRAGRICRYANFPWRANRPGGWCSTSHWSA